MRTFERVFSNLAEVEEYGFENWLDLYAHITALELEELETVEGERTFLVEQYAGAFLPELLEYEFAEIKYIVQGVKRYDVDFSGISF